MITANLSSFVAHVRSALEALTHLSRIPAYLSDEASLERMSAVLSSLTSCCGEVHRESAHNRGESKIGMRLRPSVRARMVRPSVCRRHIRVVHNVHYCDYESDSVKHIISPIMDHRGCSISFQSRSSRLAHLNDY